MLGKWRISRLVNREVSVEVSERDGIAVVVHPQNRLTGLTIDQVRSIFSGATQNWKELGGEDRAITPITREEGSGTRTAFEELVMKDAKMTWRQVADGKGWKAAVAQQYAIQSIPATFLVGPDGVVRRLELRGPALEKTLSQLIK